MTSTALLVMDVQQGIVDRVGGEEAQEYLSRLAGAALRLRKPLVLAVGVGAAVGLGSYLAGPTVAAAVSGVAGFAASLAASALRAVRGTLARAAAPHP